MFGKKKTNASPKKSSSRRHGKGRPRKSSPEDTLDNFVVEEIEIVDVGGGVAIESDTVRRRRTRVSRAGIRTRVFWIGLTALIVAASMASRGLWPPDETRFVSMAWEMWVRQDWMHPVLNGEAQPTQAPLVLWGVLAGWKLFGINDWWPRILPALCGLAAMFASQRLARRFWPEETNVIRYVPLILIGSGLWAFALTLALPIMPVVLLVVLTMLALEATAAARPLAWIGAGALIGAGVLAAGPVFLIYVVPAALTAPFWCADGQPKNWRWTPQLFKMLFIAAIPVGAWLAMTVPGKDALLELASRSWVHPLSLFYAHGAWWWYLFLIPFAFLPWAVWPLPWLRLWESRTEPTDRGLQFTVMWGLPAIALLSVLGTRQPQLLLPIFPAFAMAITWLLLRDEHAQDGEEGLLAGMAVPALVIGGLLAVLPGLPRVSLLPSFLWDLSPLVGVAVAAVGIGLTFLPGVRLRDRIGTIAVTVMFAGVAGSFVFGYEFRNRYQLNALADTVSRIEAKHFPLAVVGAYEGELHFLGRLYRPIAVLDKDGVRNWIAGHPDGVLLTYSDGWQPLGAATNQPLYEARLGSHSVRLWPADIALSQ
jgi:4-amino-4-deoxy-L-arabinose transferase-like glycosyltransferase